MRIEQIIPIRSKFYNKCGNELRKNMMRTSFNEC